MKDPYMAIWLVVAVIVLIMSAFITIPAMIDCGWSSLLYGKNVVWASWLGQC